MVNPGEETPRIRRSEDSTKLVIASDNSRVCGIYKTACSANTRENAREASPSVLFVRCVSCGQNHASAIDEAIHAISTNDKSARVRLYRAGD